MAKSKEFKLPKYLRLNKGIFWRDIDGLYSSGVELINTKSAFVGRGNDVISTETSDGYTHTLKSQSYTLKIPEDKHKNANSQQGEYGYVEYDSKDKSFFCTEKIESGKLYRIIEAYKNNILVAYTPGKEIKEPKDNEINKKNFAYKPDGDVVFVGKNEAMFKLISSASAKKLLEFIRTCNNSQDLQDLYEYEVKGYNRVSRERADVIRAITDKLNSMRPGISPIRIEDEELEPVNNKG